MLELPENLTLPSGREKSRFDTAIPGQSLTKAPKSYPWDSPPQFTDADSIVEFYMDRFNQEEVLFNLFAMLEAKVPVTKIIDAMLLHGFSEGLYTPDLAILVAEDLTMIIMLIAEEAGIDYVTGAKDNTMRALKQATELKEALVEREEMFMPQVEEKLEELRAERKGSGLMSPMETE
jgi:hypothetical protein